MNKTHGLTHHPLYKTWYEMKRRCYSRDSISYKNYGDRGITVCKEWINNIKLFVDWALTNGYEKGLEIDRINNNGNYEPSNCRFITCAENCRNSRQTKLNWDLVHEIRNAKLLIPELTQQEIADAYGVHFTTIGYVLSNKTWRE